jgi:uncharacterized membrane protein YcaP (DUF421 family)
MSTVFRGIFGYVFLVFVVRVAGRRPGKQLTPFEFVLVFFMGGLTLTGLVGNDRSLANSVCLVISIAFAYCVLSYLKQISPRVGLIVDGTPVVLLSKGQRQSESMRKMGIQDDDIMAVARDQGIRSLGEIDYAVLERNGEISIIPRAEG